MTARGAKTRERIVSAAADLMYTRGVGATTLDDIMTASGVSKSQLYRHFANKDEIVRAAIELMGERVIQREQSSLGGVTSLADLRRWRDALVQNNAVRHGAYGCALGSFASEVSDHDDVARRSLMALFAEWQDLLSGAMERLRANGALPPDAPVEGLAVGLLAALQGGYVLAQTARDVTPMATSLDMAISHIESLAT
nr:TetR/AcrR family transcriptional regulator [Leifsonia soli]